MEKVTSWLWRESKKAAPREDSYWFDNDNLIVVRGDELPADSKEMVSAAEAMLAYEVRGREKLQDHSKIVYDFLKSKGY